jgi:HTH-type transcriptional regulator/antitoxin HigA
MIPTIKADSSYGDLLLTFEPRPIQNEDEANRILDVIDALISKGDLSADERDFLVLLGSLIFLWEDGRVEPPNAAPHEVVKALLEANELRQRDLVGPVFPTESVASEVLSGKRKLTYDFVSRLSRFFHVSPEVFFGPP